MSDTPEKKGPKEVAKWYHCGKPGAFKRGEISLCVDCYYKVAQADFMEQQILHNQMSWVASNLNFVEQQLYIGHGGLLPLKQMMIPPVPRAPSYSQIRVSESTIGVINTGTLFNLDTSIQVIQNRGDKELANAVKELTQAVIDRNDIEDRLKTELAEQLEFLVTEALASKDKQRKSLARKVIDNISQSISTVGSLLTIWNTLKPLLLTYFGLQ